MSDNPVNLERSWHINTHIHCVRELVNNGVLNLKLHKVPGVDDVADALTKSVQFQVLEKHREYLWGHCSGVCRTSPGPAGRCA
eukprot:1436745-Rhodomonas_salina.1